MKELAMRMVLCLRDKHGMGFCRFTRQGEMRERVMEGDAADALQDAQKWMERDESPQFAALKEAMGGVIVQATKDAVKGLRHLVDTHPASASLAVTLLIKNLDRLADEADEVSEKMRKEEP